MPCRLQRHSGADPSGSCFQQPQPDRGLSQALRVGEGSGKHAGTADFLLLVPVPAAVRVTSPAEPSCPDTQGQAGCWQGAAWFLSPRV